MSQPNALSREFRKYDQVEKTHTYRLAEHERDEFDEEYEIATLDFGPFLRGNAGDQARFADAFGAALQEIGFAVLTGHDVDAGLYDQAHDSVGRLFASTPLAEKMRFRAGRHGSVNQGYFPIEETSEIHPDLVEGWLWCRRAFDVPQRREEPRGRVVGLGRVHGLPMSSKSSSSFRCSVESRSFCCRSMMFCSC